MGAACTRIDVSPDVAQTLHQLTLNTTNNVSNRNYRKYVRDASFETIWKHVAPYIINPEKKIIIQQLLSYYLRTKPCRDHYLSLNIDGYTWLFEIQSNRRITRTFTEIVLSNTRQQKN
jgi:hypothetical protein